MIIKRLKDAKFVEKAVNILMNALIIAFSAVLLVSLYTTIQTRILGHKYADFFGYSVFEVQSNSMEDKIFAGDWIVIKLTKRVKIDDVVTYELKGDYITHRVIEIHGSTYITKGDANNTKDDPVDQSQIIGRLVRRLGGFGILRRTLFNPVVLVTLIITLFLFNSILKKDEKVNNMFEKVKDYFVKTYGNARERIPSKKTSYNTPYQDLPQVQPMIEETVVSVDDSEIENRDYEKELEDFLLEDDEMEYSDEDDEVIQIDKLEEVFDDKSTTVDLDKTMAHRIIPVDLSDYDDTLLEIAKNEMAENENKKEEKEEEVKEEPIPEEDSLTKIDLELIKNNTRKNKNIVDAMINIKKEELNEVISVFVKDDKIQANEATIKNAFITTYINARYYNYYDDEKVEYRGKNIVIKIERVIKIVATKLMQCYRGNDKKYNYKVYIYAYIFKIIANLDHAKDGVTELKAKREFYRDEITKCYKDWNSQKVEKVINEIIKIQKSYSDILKYFLKKLETNTFFLDFNKIPSKKDLFAVDLGHNIAFNKIYSDYIIDKTYSEGIVAEDKVSVLFTLLLSQVIRDMIEADFSKKYIIHISDSLYKKEKKILRLLKMIDDEYTKSHISIMVTFKDMISNKNIIKKIKKLGYRFVLAFDNDVGLGSKERSNLYLAELIFINKKDKNYEEINAYIPEDLVDIVVYEDIVSKIGVNIE